MRDIQEAIAQKRDQIKRLERDIEALQRAQEILLGNDQSAEKPKSQPDMVHSILEEVGKPMHVAQIAEQMKKKFGIAVKTTNLGVMLYRYAQRAKRFYKVKGKPNTYGLLKWESIEGTEVLKQMRAS
jgi:hypothetical protein